MVCSIDCFSNILGSFYLLLFFVIFTFSGFYSFSVFYVFMYIL